MYIGRQFKSEARNRVPRQIKVSGTRQRAKFEDGRNHIKFVIQRFPLPDGYEEHVKGEYKGSALTGGHSKSLMESKWNAIEANNLTISGTQEDDKVYSANWTIKKHSKSKEYSGSSKTSTFFPNKWDFDKIKTEIESVTLLGGKNYAESTSGIMIEKRGDTAFPKLVALDNQENVRNKSRGGNRGKRGK